MRSFVINDKNRKDPLLVGLVFRDADLGFKGIAEAEYLYRRLGREFGTILPTGIFIFSIDTYRG